MLPCWSGLFGSKAPDHVAMSPVEPTSVRIMSVTRAAIETPIQRSLSVFEAKVRIQKLERKKSFVRIAIGRM